MPTQNSSFEQRLANGIVSGSLNPNAQNFAINALTGGEWSNGSVIDPRYPDPNNAPVLPDIDQWREQWKADPESRELRGTHGEALPTHALSWDYAGRPYYGEGIQGWWNGFYSRFTAIWDEPDPDAIKEADTTLEQYKTQNERAHELFWSGDFEGYVKEGATSLLSQIGAIGALWEKGEQSGGVLGAAAKATGNVLQSFLFEPLQALGAGAVRILGTANNLSLWAEQEPLHNKDNVPPTIGYRGYTQDDFDPADTFGDRAREAWEASRITATGIKDVSIKHEFLRRLRAGEDPRYLEMELADPIAEAILETIVDPLNWISPLLKVSKLAGRYNKLSDWVNATGRAQEILQDGAIAAGKMDDLASRNLIDELVDLQVNDLTRIETKTTGDALKTGLFSTTTEGNRNITREATRVWLGDILTKARGEGMNVDDLRDVFSAVAKLGSKTGNRVDNVREATLILKNFPYPAAMFSDAAKTMSVMLNAAGDPATFVRSIAEAKDIDSVLAITNQALDAGLNAAFPSIGDRIAEIDRIKDAAKAADTKPVIPAGLEPGDFARKVWSADNSKLAKAWKGLTRGYSTIYMGFSPGYAMRNHITNTLSIWVDEGFGAAFRPFKNVEADAKLLGLDTGQVSAFNAGTAGIVGESRNVDNLFDLNPKNWLGWDAPSLKAAQILERRASLRVAVSAYKRAVKSRLREGLAFPQLDTLIKAGLPAEEAGVLRTILTNSLGDDVTALSRWRDAKKQGYYELFRDLDYHLSPDDLKSLRKEGWDEPLLSELQQMTDLPDASTRLDNYLISWREDAAKASRQHFRANVENMLEGEQHLVDLENAPGITEDQFNLLSNVSRTRANATTALKDANNTYYDLAIKAAQKAGDREKVDALIAFRKSARGYFEDSTPAIQKVRAEMDAIAEATNKYVPAGEAAGLRTNATRTKYVNTKWGGPQRAWKAWGLPGEPPTDLTVGQLWDAMWQRRYVSYDTGTAKIYELQVKSGEKIAKQLAKLAEDVSPPSQLYQNATDKLEFAEKAALSAIEDEAWVLPANFDEMIVNEPKNALQLLGKQYGITDPNHLLRAINKNLPHTDDVPFEKLGDVQFAQGATALELRAKAEGLDVIPLDKVKVRGTPLLPPASDASFSVNWAAAENLPDVERIVEKLRKSLRAKWGHVQGLNANNPELDAAFNAFQNEVKQRFGQIRSTSKLEANAARDMTLINYGNRRNIDLAAAYVYPYSFWHTRTYANWMRRIASDGDVIARYARYRETMQEIHAGQPEWWKYNISSDEILGIESDNPLIFNLEAAFNPLHSLVKEDFSDPEKRVNWWTRTLDDLGKFGPSTHPMLSLLTAIGLSSMGEEDAAARWAGRLAPQTQAIKSATSLAGIGGPGGLELDPWVILFSDGMTPYERSRIGKAFGALMEKYPDQREAILDAARTQSGPLWDEAIVIAAHARDAGNLASFFLGVGFKGRTKDEMEVDQALQGWSQLWTLRDTLTPEEFRLGVRDLNAMYPELEPVLLARKGGDARDAAYAYNILNRLPPGDSLAAVAGIPYDLVSQFYESKGDMSEWTEGDRLRFMGAIVDAGALLQIPDDATRNEWDRVREMQSQLSSTLTSAFGEDIYDKIDGFYNAEDKDAYLEAHPDVSLALDLKGQMLVSNPQLAAYYGGIDAIEKYYNGLAANKLEKQFPGVDKLWDEYWLLKDTGKEKEATAFYRNNPILKQYNLIRDQYKEQAAQAIISLGLKLPQVQEAELRTDLPVEGVGQQETAESLQPAEQFTVSNAQWKTALGNAVYNQVIDLVFSGEALDTFAANKIQQLAQQLGMSEEELIQQISQSINQ